jgi:hypothetical protein
VDIDTIKNDRPNVTQRNEDSGESGKIDRRFLENEGSEDSAILHAGCEDEVLVVVFLEEMLKFRNVPDVSSDVRLVERDKVRLMLMNTFIIVSLSREKIHVRNVGLQVDGRSGRSVVSASEVRKLGQHPSHRIQRKWHRMLHGVAAN